VCCKMSFNVEYPGFASRNCILSIYIIATIRVQVSFLCFIYSVREVNLSANPDGFLHKPFILVATARFELGSYCNQHVKKHLRLTKYKNYCIFSCLMLMILSRNLQSAMHQSLNTFRVAAVFKELPEILFI
jgi:hypothetical protein